MHTRRRTSAVLLVLGCIWAVAAAEARSASELRLTRAEYEDRVHAVWAGQMIGMLLTYPFESRVASTIRVEDFRKPFTWSPLAEDYARVDDDWYYEIVALRGFEKYGIEMTVGQLGKQWLEDSAGSWGSSAEARRALLAGVAAPDSGHPRYNKLWYSIGPQFSADVYGALAAGMPNVAGGLARRLSHVNGYAEGSDGAVFIAGMVSIAFRQTDSREVVRQASALIDASSPYRQCLELVIGMAESGASFEEVADAVEDRWHMEYPVTNNAVGNGGLVAAAVWYGGGDLMKTANLIARAADFTDADCNGANACGVVGAMRGTSCLPAGLLAKLNDRVKGARMGPVTFERPVEESISGLARRTAAVGLKILEAHGAEVSEDHVVIPIEEVITQEPERFRLADLMQYWNPQWTLDRAGFGGYRYGLRGGTELQGDVLVTYPRDEVRGLVLRRRARLGQRPRLRFQAGADAERGWLLSVWVDNRQVEKRLIEGKAGDRAWETIEVDLGAWAGQEVHLRLYQLVLARGVSRPGSAYWKELTLD